MGIIDRILITGVSHLTMDSLTNTFNIAFPLSNDLLPHDAMGFTSEEAERLIYKAGPANDDSGNSGKAELVERLKKVI
jgi:hypothetical protein